MEIEALHNVTNVLPLIVPQMGKRSQGWIVLPTGMHSVRLVPKKQPALNKMFAKLEKAIHNLRYALMVPTADGLARAIKGSGEWMPFSDLGATTYDFDKPLSTLIEAARSDYAALANFALRETRMVMWSEKNGMRPARPALYCPDVQIAVLAGRVLDPTQLRLCQDPRCRVLFTPLNRRQVYHLPACRVRAFRTRPAV